MSWGSSEKCEDTFFENIVCNHETACNGFDEMAQP